MYGGYYVEYIDENDRIRGEHFGNFKELSGFVSGKGWALKKNIRRDN